MQPRHRRETVRPVWPKRTYSMAGSCRDEPRHPSAGARRAKHPGNPVGRIDANLSSTGSYAGISHDPEGTTMRIRTKIFALVGGLGLVAGLIAGVALVDGAHLRRHRARRRRGRDPRPP